MNRATYVDGMQIAGDERQNEPCNLDNPNWLRCRNASARVLLLKRQLVDAEKEKTEAFSAFQVWQGETNER